MLYAKCGETGLPMLDALGAARWRTLRAGADVLVAPAPDLLLEPESGSEGPLKSLVIGEKHPKKLVRFAHKSPKLSKYHPKNSSVP